MVLSNHRIPSVSNTFDNVNVIKFLSYHFNAKNAVCTNSCLQHTAIKQLLKVMFS